MVVDRPRRARPQLAIAVITAGAVFEGRGLQPVRLGRSLERVHLAWPERCAA
jgi:hypothetical protein